MRSSRWTVPLAVVVLLGPGCYRDARSTTDDDRARGSHFTDRSREYDKARQTRIDEENADRARRSPARTGEVSAPAPGGESPLVREQREARERIEARNHDRDSDLIGR